MCRQTVGIRTEPGRTTLGGEGPAAGVTGRSGRLRRVGTNIGSCPSLGGMTCRRCDNGKSKSECRPEQFAYTSRRLPRNGPPWQFSAGLSTKDICAYNHIPACTWDMAKAAYFQVW